MRPTHVRRAKVPSPRALATSLRNSSLADQPPHLSLRNTPLQARSRARLGRVLDGAEEVLEQAGASGFTTTAVARAAGVSVGSVYRFFGDKQAIVEALAVRYWSDFADLVAGVAEADALEALADPVEEILAVLAAGMRSRPGFLALWYGGLRTEQVRDRTRNARQAIAASVEQILANHWPAAVPQARTLAAAMVVLAGDGLLREAFRLDATGDPTVLAETQSMLRAYLDSRLA